MEKPGKENSVCNLDPPVLPKWYYAVVKESNGFRVRRQSIPILAPPVSGGVTLEKSFNPSLPHLRSMIITLHSQKISHPIPSCSVSCHIVLTM